ncbi:MAG: two-component system response regulator [Ferruginibacter sp.]|jgi:CheY-like chemotaxis protein|uniref:response regulator n=1 Tax=Ferruginibacter sp. TaxID=1940288 RepID=UPI0026587C12|nr:response regulator [Ferruginibacter sp.]MDB5278442.1 two-component system response regulator [Ferruginibacter sp.]
MKSIHILLVEDNEGDIVLTTEALEEGRICNHISVVKDGDAAVHFLNRTGIYMDAMAPDLILLDVNLPKKNGLEVLEIIKTSDTLKQIPVIMLTTSSSEKDIVDSYRKYANCYITKPVEVKEFITAIEKVEDFWINIVKLPGKR